MDQLVFSRFLRYFAEVARAGSIRRASEVLNVSASAIDRQILNAEEALGVALFERLPAGLRLTAAGEMLLNAGRTWTKDFERLQARLMDLKGLRRGHVTIAVIDALSKGFVSDVIRQTRADFPGITFTIRVLDNVDVSTALAAGSVDFGIMLNPRVTRDLQVHAHLEVSVGLVSRPGDLAANPSGIRFNQCADLPMVVPTDPLAIAEQVEALVSSTGVSLNIVAGSDNIQMIKSLVADGVGAGILSSIDVMKEVAEGELMFTVFTDAILKPLNLALCSVPVRQLSSAANLVLGRIGSAFSATASGLNIR